jgi:hypothetical protein
MSRKMNKALNLIYTQIIAPWIGAMNPTIEALYIDGVIAGSELIVYNVNKLYIASSLELGSANSSNNLAQGVTTFYDAANAAKGSIQNQSISFDTVAAVMIHASGQVEISNILFSRIAPGARITQYRFVGYRITRA